MILSSSSAVTSWEQKVPEGTNLHDFVFIQRCVYTWCRCVQINLHMAPNRRIPWCLSMSTKSTHGHKPSWSCLHPLLCLYMMQTYTYKSAQGTKQDTYPSVLAWEQKVPKETNLHDLVFIQRCDIGGNGAHACLFAGKQLRPGHRGGHCGSALWKDRNTQPSFNPFAAQACQMSVA